MQPTGGDVLLVLPAVHALARSHPGAEVTVLTFAPGDVLLAHDPLVAARHETARRILDVIGRACD